MIIRTWQTEIDPERVEEFESFANNYSLPMFQQQPGCLGVLFSREDSDTTTFSYWKDQGAIDMLASSPLYLETVRRIQETGLLRGEQVVDVFPVFGGQLDLNQGVT